jgi:hypothetical protein
MKVANVLVLSTQHLMNQISSIVHPMIRLHWQHYPLGTIGASHKNLTWFRLVNMLGGLPLNVIPYVLKFPNPYIDQHEANILTEIHLGWIT